MRAKKPTTLKDFLEDEMRTRHLSPTDFAKLIGVSHSLISQHTSGRDPRPTPSMKFLFKLSSGTQKPLIDLLAIVYPEVREELKVDASAEVLARRIMAFPQKTRDSLIGIVESMEKGGNNH